MKRSDVFMKVGVAVALTCLIAGIIIGICFPNTELVEASPSIARITGEKMTIEESFNFVAALIIWLFGAATTLGCYAMYGHFDNQEKMLEYEKSTDEKLSRLVTHFVGEEVKKPQSPSKKLNLSNIVSEDKNGSWICSNCQTKNSSSELTCKDCGAKK